MTDRAGIVVTAEGATSARRVRFRSEVGNRTWHSFGDPRHAGDVSQLSGVVAALFRDHMASNITIEFTDGDILRWELTDD